MFKSHFKIVFRTLLRSKGYTALNVFGLAIGLTCVILVAAWSLNELSFDRFHSKHDRIFRIVGNVKTNSETFEQAVTSPPLKKALIADYAEIENAVRLDMNDCIVRYQTKQFEEDGVLFTDQSFFDIFDFPLIYGDEETALQDPYSVVLTESIAQKYFAEKNPIGKSLRLFVYDPEGMGELYKITGVTADPPQNAHFSFTMLGSFATYESIAPEDQTDWFENGFYTYILLKNNVDQKVFESKLPDFVERHMGDSMRDLQLFYKYSLQPLAEIHLNSHLRYEIQQTGNMSTVYIFATVGLFILLIACINYMNLATARSLGRAKEVGVKRVLGARKNQLIRQFLVESITVTFVSFLFALLFVELLQPLFFDLTGTNLPNVFTFELLLLVSAITLLVGMAAGLYPAFFVYAVGVTHILKGKFKSSGMGIATRKGLVILQFVIAITLLVGIAVIKSQMDFIQQKDLGFKKEALLLLKQNGYVEVLNNIEPFKNELLSNSAIQGVAITRGVITGGLSNSLVETVDGTGRPVSSSIYRHQVGPDFIKVYGIELLAGRDFVPADTAGAFIVNEAAVNAFGWGHPQQAIGKPFRRGRLDGNIIGVVKDFHFNGLQHAIDPVELHLTNPNAFSRIAVRLETANLPNTVDFVKSAWQKHFPEALLQYTFLDDRLQNQYAQERQFGNLLTVFVVVSFIIACLGLLGLASFDAEQRTKEVGLRKVLGSSVFDVVSLLSKDFLKLVFLANIIAWPIAWFVMNKWLEEFVYRITISWWIFILAGGLVLVIALLTVCTQAIRAALVNPVEAMRYE